MAVVLGGVQAPAQIGQSPEAGAQSWGSPVSGQVNPQGYGTLRFNAEPFAVEMDFVAARAQRIVYRTSDWNDTTIDRILDLNSDGQEWHTYQRPGQNAEPHNPRRWARGEDSAMAELVDGVLTMVGANWYHHLAEPPSTEATGGHTGDKAAEAAPDPSLAPPRDPIVGFWVFKEKGEPAVVLHGRENGELSWVRFDKTERRVLDIRWKREHGMENPFYTLTPARTGASSPRFAGQLELRSPNRLQWHPDGGIDGDHEAARWAMKNDILFDRTEAIPRWRPKAPAVLPAKGTTRNEAIGLLGPPGGTMLSEGREVLVYPWGNVWITNGVVSGTD